MAIQFEAKLPRSLPKEAAVYNLTPPRISNQLLTKSAKALRLTGQGKDFITSQDTIAYREGRHHLEIHRASGALQLRHLDRYGRDTEKPFDLSDKRADSIARRFLEEAALFSMSSATLRGVTHLRGADADVETRKVREKILDAGVVYGRTVDGIPVDGPGGFTLVNIDPEEEVVGLRSIWRNLGQRAGTVKIKSPDEAFRDFEKRASRFKGDTIVTKAGFSYFEQGPLDKQAVLEPTYWFVYVVRLGEVAHKSAHVIHAGDKKFSRLEGKRRFPGGRQSPRKGD